MLRGALRISLIAGLLLVVAAAPPSLAQSSGCSKPCSKASPPEPIPLRERFALIALYRSTDGDHWTHHDGWLGPRGTECAWVGVTCGTTDSGTGVQILDLHDNGLVGTIPSELGNLRHLVWLRLQNNRLRGAIPAPVGRLSELTWLDLSGNQLAGMIPRALIQRWLEGPLNIEADERLLTDISEIDYESSSTSVLCARDRYILRNDGSVTSYSVHCRHATPNDRTTYCEVKQGRLGFGAFAELGWLIERNGFFGFGPEYYRNITESSFENTRVTRRGKAHAVSSYAGAGPVQLWGIELAISGVAASADWQKSDIQPQCPRWQ